MAKPVQIRYDNVQRTECRHTLILDSVSNWQNFTAIVNTVQWHL